MGSHQLCSSKSTAEPEAEKEQQKVPDTTPSPIHLQHPPQHQLWGAEDIVTQSSHAQHVHTMTSPMTPPQSRRAHKHNGKRGRSFRSTTATADRTLSFVDMHDLAYWCQWRLAMRGVCARFEAEAHVEAEAWSRERRDEASISRQAALSEEVRHLESQLGKHTSMNAKLGAALSEKAQALASVEAERIAAVAAVERLQVSRVSFFCTLFDGTRALTCHLEYLYSAAVKLSVMVSGFSVKFKPHT